MSNQVVDKSLPKIRMEKPITNTRFSTLPTACVRGATLSKVLVANWKFKRKKLFIILRNGIVIKKVGFPDNSGNKNEVVELNSVCECKRRPHHYLICRVLLPFCWCKSKALVFKCFFLDVYIDVWNSFHNDLSA